MTYFSEGAENMDQETVYLSPAQLYTGNGTDAVLLQTTLQSFILLRNNFPSFRLASQLESFSNPCHLLHPSNRKPPFGRPALLACGSLHGVFLKGFQLPHDEHPNKQKVDNAAKKEKRSSTPQPCGANTTSIKNPLNFRSFKLLSHGHVLDALLLAGCV